MKRIKITMTVAVLAFSLAVACAAAHAQSGVTQTFTLRPGWNAVFLEVQPEPRDPATVFSGLAHLESVWVWLSREPTAEFIQSPDEGLWSQPGWHAYFKAEETDFRSQLTNLHAIFAGWAYLIKIKQGAPAEIPWTVSGSPSLKKIRWLADSFNMVGFHVDQSAPPNFAAFFAPSPAHEGQAMYRLNKQNGTWEFVQNPTSVKVQSGEAYWVYCEGSSTYQGPLRVDLPMSDGLFFGDGLTKLTITVSNLSAVTRTVSFSLTGDVVLYYREWDLAEGYYTWKPLDQMPPIALESERSQNVWLEVRREQMAVGLSESVMEIADDKGIRIRVPVSAERIQ